MRRTAKTMAMQQPVNVPVRQPANWGTDAEANRSGNRGVAVFRPLPARVSGHVTARYDKMTVAAALLASALLLSACGTTTLKHGQHYTQAELLQIQPGMSQDEVRMALGSPATTSTVNAGAAYYYIASTRTQTAFLDPKEVDRKVVAVYFTPVGSVERVAQYGMQDGKVFDFITRQTPPATKTEDGVIQMLFRNLGRRGSVFGE